MIAESIKKDVRAELLHCESRRDVRRTIALAQKDFQERSVPLYRRQEVLKDIRSHLKEWIDRESDPKSADLVLEGQMAIDALLVGNS